MSISKEQLHGEARRFLAAAVLSANLAGCQDQEGRKLSAELPHSPIAIAASPSAPEPTATFELVSTPSSMLQEKTGGREESKANLEAGQSVGHEQEKEFMVVVDDDGKVIRQMGVRSGEAGPSEEEQELVLPVPIDAQDFSLSCESAAAAMAAAYFNPEPPEGFATWERYFIGSIPRHCNPHRGYRGNINGYASISCEGPYGYGVYAEPIATAFNNAGIPARVEYGVDYQDVANEVRAGRPVLIWTSKKNVKPKYETDAETNQEYVLYLGEHCVTVIGVSADNKSFLINDPNKKGRQYWVESFSNWSAFNGMRVVVGE